MKDRTMTYSEILSHSMPFLNAVCTQVNRLRVIEAGGNSDRSADDECDSSAAHSSKQEEVESTLSDAAFYGQLNALLG